MKKLKSFRVSSRIVSRATPEISPFKMYQLGYLFVCLFIFKESVSLCSICACPGTSSCNPGWPQTHTDLPASAS